MPKIKAEIEVPSDKYCENEYTTCPMCLEGNWGMCYCALFGDDLETDEIMAIIASVATSANKRR